MNLVSEIVQILSDSRPSLENALIKTKVLLHRLGETAYVDWINKELNGYEKEDEVPPYRVLQASVKLVVTNGFTRYFDMPAPLGHLKDSERQHFEQTKLRQSISSLESLAGGEGSILRGAISPDAWGFLHKGLGQGFFIENASSELAKAQLQGVLTQIRSRLLDFVLRLEGRIPPEASEQQVRELSKSVDINNLFNNAMFGHNTTFIFGDHNRQQLTFSVVQKGDFDSLACFLKSRGVDDADLTTLKAAIEGDGVQAVGEKKEFGPRVRDWLKTMLAKAVDASWQIEVGIASNLLTDALKHYYGS